jgi:uncharacterized protein with ParB-like and HNH nuclease domain
MHPSTTDIISLFEKSRRYLVPIFQRSYVWSENSQWKPLWTDISNKADSLFEKDPNDNAQIRKHFLGAIVLFFHQPSKFNPHIPADEIIDGQQRLTTIQILLIALRDFIKKYPVGNYSIKLRRLTSNELAEEPKEDYKVWPSITDRTVFEKIYNAGSLESVEEVFPLTKYRQSRYTKPRPKLVDAYLFFSRQITVYVSKDLNESGGGLDNTLTVIQQERLKILIDAITKYIEIVIIELDEKDDPQIIFEALNDHREPLLPSDLIRNMVFLHAQSSGKSVEDIHKKYWADYDDIEHGSGQFWNAEESRGRRNNKRFDIFIFYYLILQKKTDIPLTNLYQEFREWWNSSSEKRDIEIELQELNRYSDLFKKFYYHEKNTRFGDFTQRLKELDTTTIYPLILFLLGLEAETIDEADKLKIFCDIESYLIRRAVCGLTPKNYNRFFLALLKNISQEKKITYSWFHEYLLKQTEETSKWPTDNEFLTAWLERPIYHSGTNLSRMILKAIDKQLKTPKEIEVKIDGEVSVEHIIPQNIEAESWKIHFPDGTDELERIRALEKRRLIIHTIGNLTLVAGSLNSSIQDGEFKLKRHEILRHNSIRLSSYFLDFKDTDVWSEDDILKRGESLFGIAKSIWARY